MRFDWLTRAGLAVIAASALASSSGLSAPASSPAVCVTSYDADALGAGDIVLIAVDRALWARVAAATSTPGRRYGHVGIVVEGDGGAVRIVHARGSPTASNAVVVSETPQAFWRDADRVGVLRPAQASLAPAIAASALRFLGFPFDRHFSLQSEDEIYCTELVWRAMTAALGVDAAPDKAVLAGRAAVTLAMLENHPLLSEAFFWPDACA